MTLHRRRPLAVYLGVLLIFISGSVTAGETIGASDAAGVADKSAGEFAKIGTALQVWGWSVYH